MRTPMIYGCAVAALALTGCATLHQSESAIAAARQAATHRTHTQMAHHKPAVFHEPYPDLIGTRIALRHVQLPALFSGHATLVTGEPWSLAQIAGRIAQISGLPTRVNYSAQMSQMSGTMSGQQTSTISPPPGLAGGPAAVAGGLGEERRMRVDWNGSLTGLLNLVAARAGVFWRYDRGVIVFFLTESRTFPVHILPGISAVKSQVSNSGSSGGSGSSGSYGSSTSSSGGSGSGSASTTSQTVSTTTTLDAYKGVTGAIKALLAEVQGSSSGGGGAGITATVNTSVFADPAEGTVTVTATPPLLRIVSRYIRDLNRRMERQVLISVHVYNVQLSRSSTNGLNLSAAFHSIGVTALTLTGAAPVNPPTGDTGATLGAAVVSPTSNWSGSSSVAQALATQGNVALVTSAQILALDDQPAPLQVGNQITYLASSSTTAAGLGGATTSLTPGQLTVGFSANFLPMIVRHARVLLDYSMNIAQLQSIATITSGGSSIQEPNVATQSIMQHALLRNGATLVLSGFEQTNDTVNRTGTGSARFWGLGGGVGAVRSRTVLVIAIGVHVI